MSHSFQAIRSCVQQRTGFGKVYSIRLILNQQSSRNRGLHSLTRNVPVKFEGKTFEGFQLKQWTRGTILGKSRPLASVVVLCRNESTNAGSNTFFTEIKHEVSPAAGPEAVTAATSNSTTPLGDVAATPVVQSSQLSDATSSSPSSPDVSQDVLVFESIPEPPSIPLPVDEVTGAIIGEPSLASLGLGGWSPSGIAQQCLEFFHINLGMPWWASIVTGTILVRLLLFPLVIKSQRNAARMHNYMPQLQVLQEKMTEARQTGNALLAAKYGQDMAVFMKEKDVNPLKSMIVPVAMAPVFISFFFGLRKMANLPVESMKEGGLFWFTDLTIADPYYLLPLITSVTMWITLEVGADGVKLNNSQHGHIAKYVFRAIPVIMFPFTMNFPGAILCYWVSTNAISLIQVSCLKIPAVREALKIEPLKKFTPDMLPGKEKKGFRASFKESWTNMKITREIEERQRYDEISFKRAGRGPVPKTFKYDPTKTNAPAGAAVQAKKK